MAYTLTTDEFAQFQELYNSIKDPTSADFEKYYLAYHFLADVQATPSGLKPFVDAGSYLWFRGAEKINQGTGPFSTFVREYAKSWHPARGPSTASIMESAFA